MYDFIHIPSDELVMDPRYNPLLKNTHEVSNRTRRRFKDPPKSSEEVPFLHRFKLFRWISRFFSYIVNFFLFWNVRQPDSNPKLSEIEKLVREKEAEERKHLYFKHRAQVLEKNMEEWIELNSSILVDNRKLKEEIKELEIQLEESKKNYRELQFSHDGIYIKLNSKSQRLLEELELKDKKLKKIENILSSIGRLYPHLVPHELTQELDLENSQNISTKPNLSYSRGDSWT